LILRALLPSDAISSDERRKGLTMLLLDGVCTQTMLVLTGGAFLVAFALLLGASHKLIGVIAAAGPIAQILQLPGIYLVERVRLRKALVVACAGFGRVFLLLMAVAPWVLPEARRLPVFVLGLFLFFGIGAVGGAAFTPWMRDLVPHRVLGRYFGRRLAVAVSVGAVVSIVAGRAVDVYIAHHASSAPAYAALFVAGALVGFAGVGFLSRIPEPRMSPPPERSVWAVVAEPFRDAGFRPLMSFFGRWSFAANFAGPFFSVYLLERLGLSLTWIMALFLVSQAAYVVFLRVWGHIADRTTQKAVLTVSGPLFLFSIALWPFTALSGPRAIALGLLAAIHALAGASTAGMALCGWNMAIKLAPRDRSASYLASNALVSGVAATAAPIAAGVAADRLDAAGVHLVLGPASWVARGLPVLDLQALDFVFLASIAAGLLALRRLRLVEERGPSAAGVSLADVQAEIRAAVRSVSSVAGLRFLSSFPYGIVRRRSAESDDEVD
jgi:MFS family permease